MYKIVFLVIWVLLDIPVFPQTKQTEPAWVTFHRDDNAQKVDHPHRVDRAFETPSETPEIFTDASGKQTTVPVLNNEGVNGVYRSSEGKEKDAVWGTRASWVSLTATKAGEEISICLFDHPSNPGYPACWHARGYGLFSVNNIGRKGYNPNEPENTLMLNKGETVEFRYMILIKTGGGATENEMNNQFKEFKSSPDHAATK